MKPKPIFCFGVFNRSGLLIDVYNWRGAALTHRDSLIAQHGIRFYVQKVAITPVERKKRKPR